MNNNNNLPTTILKAKYYHDIKRLRIELGKMRIQVSELDTNILSCLNELEEQNSAYPRKCKDLESEINQLSIKMREHLRKHGGESKNPFHDAGQIKKKVKIKMDPDKEKKLKDLFKSISMVTHPDVAKNPELIPLFIEAKNAYENQDILELQRILEMVNGNEQLHIKIENFDPEELKREYDILINDLETEKIEMNKMLGSVQYKIYNLHSSEDDVDNMIANKIFLDVILAKLVQLKRQRDELKSEVTKKGIV